MHLAETVPLHMFTGKDAPTKPESQYRNKNDETEKKQQLSVMLLQSDGFNVRQQDKKTSCVLTKSFRRCLFWDYDVACMEGQQVCSSKQHC